MTELLAGLRHSMIPATRGGRILAAGAMVDSFGSGLFLGAATLYFVGFLHLPAAQVAGAMSAGAVCGLLSPLVAGWVADRHGALQIYVALMLLRCLTSAAFPLIHDVAGFLLLACLLAATDRPCSPLLQVIVSAVAGQAERTHTLATMRAARNVGITAGLLVAGMVLAMRVRAAFTAIFLADAVSFLVIARMVCRATQVAQPPPGAGRAGTMASPASPFRNPRFLLFTAANGVLSLHDTMLVAMLPIWVIQRTVLPHSWVPLLLAVNTVLTVLLQGYVARFARTVDGALRLVWCTALALITGCAFFALAQRSPLVLALAAATGAVLATTLAENIHAAAGWKLSDALSPPGARARYLGAFSMGLSGQRIIGPVLLVTVLLPLGGWAWGVLAPLFAISAGIVVHAGRKATERMGQLSTRTT